MLSRAIALRSPLDRRRLELLQPLGVALQEMGRFDEAVAVLAEAEEGGRALGDRGMELRASTRHKFIWMIRSPDATHASALEELERAIPALEELHDDAGLAEALRLMGMVRMWSGHLGEAYDVWARAAQHADRAGDRRVASDVRHHMGLSVTQSPRPVAEALQSIEATIQDHGDDPALRSQMHRFQAELEAKRGRFDDARRHLQQGIDTAHQFGLLGDLGGGFLRSAGYVELMAGDLAAAEDALRRGVEMLEEMGDAGHRVSVAADLALVLLETEGREREALDLADANEQLVIEDDVDAVVRWDAARARAMVRLGDVDEAERLARESVRLAWDTEYIELRTLSLAALAEVLQRTERLEEAAGALRKILGVFEEKGDVVSAAAARSALEQVESGAGTPGR